MDSSLFELHLPTLTVVVCLVLVTAAALMTLVGLTQRVYRGFWWWTTAQWLTTLSPVCLLLRDLSPWMLPLSALLSLQWPLMMLAGLRRFHAHARFPMPGWADPVLPLLGTAAYAAVWARDASDMAARVAVFSLFNVAGYLYAMWHVQAIPGWRLSPYLKAVRLFLIGGAVLQAPRLVTAMQNWGIPLSDPQHIQQPAVLLGLVVAVMVSVYMCLLLTYERTEQELRESHRQLRELADIDMLTQVPNRRHFHDVATAALRLSRPEGAVVLRIDIDDLRQLNDQHGHAAGDEALKLVATHARALLAERDVIGRIGGDQFVALLPDMALQDTLHLAQRLMRKVTQARDARGLPALSLSFGMVSVREGETLALALSRAEQALKSGQHDDGRQSRPCRDSMSS